nr:hypothetical protein [Lysobacter enzymogenes]
MSFLGPRHQAVGPTQEDAMKGISSYGRSGVCALALLGGMAGSTVAAARDKAAEETENLQRFAEVMLAKGRNEQCKVLDEARTQQLDDDVTAILKKLEKRVSPQKLLGVALNATVATGEPASAANCDEAARQSVEAGSEQARTWADELRGRRSRGNSTQGK